LVTAWRDKKARKPVVIATSRYGVDNVTVARKSGEVTIPLVIDEYNQCMNGCDRADQMVNYYGHYHRKTMKWWKRLFYWLLEIAQFNAYVIFKLTKTPGNKYGFLSYKHALVTQILEKVSTLDEVATVPRSVGRPTSNPVERLQSTPRVRHLIDYHKDDRNCVVCSTPTNRKRTHFICTGCSDKPHLHPKECFCKYHTEIDYKK
jgi:hypothetical protein